MEDLHSWRPGMSDTPSDEGGAHSSQPSKDSNESERRVGGAGGHSSQSQSQTSSAIDSTMDK